MRYALTLLTLLVPLGAAAGADDEGTPEGFTALFDGKTLNGWQMVNTKGNFYVKDGILVMDKGKGWLASDKTYSDFELRVRYRFITAGADSGIFIRSSLEGTNWTNHGYQIQNMDNKTLGAVVGMGVKVKGSHRDEVVETVKRPSPEWQNVSIRAYGKSVKVRLNGKTVGESDDLSIANGHIGLQAEGGVLEFERIDIRPLP